MSKFKVGDRVVVVDSFGGPVDTVGEAGEIVNIDDTFSHLYVVKMDYDGDTWLHNDNTLELEFDEGVGTEEATYDDDWSVDLPEDATEADIPDRRSSISFSFSESSGGGHDAISMCLYDDAADTLDAVLAKFQQFLQGAGFQYVDTLIAFNSDMKECGSSD